MKNKIVNFGSLVLLMLITGVFWGTWFTITRSIESFSVGEFIHIGKVIIANVAMPMRIIMPAGLLFLLLSLLFCPKKKSTSFYFGILSFVWFVIVLLITLTVLVPIDNQIKQWTVAYYPVDWENIRDKWKIFHAVRTFASLAGFVSFAVSILEGQTNKPDIKEL